MSGAFSFTGIDVWHNHENLILEILHEVLDRLAMESKWSSTKEDLINRRVKQIWNQVNQERARASRAYLNGLSYEMLIPPGALDPDKLPHENKRPDFQISIYDHNEQPEYYERSFTIECKRLDKNHGSRDFCMDYVNDGVQRFLSTEHQYGLRTRSGAMIGYIQDIQYSACLRRVNSHVVAKSVARIERKDSRGPLRMLAHQLDRELPEKNFTLHHLWTEFS